MLNTGPLHLLFLARSAPHPTFTPTYPSGFTFKDASWKGLPGHLGVFPASPSMSPSVYSLPVPLIICGSFSP